ncbi:hypothetical protein [Nocardia blacklockiae]|uniref:hypothetical protein n=1 Tax=Nocardia blacklockiae TaxID=480036 RepID=UPI00189599A6|nr:hypothetical protein [Nocardia blacklockiae]MBF6171047.1 hypothetical protein [Nocardia blacklockiae]
MNGSNGNSDSSAAPEEPSTAIRLHELEKALARFGVKRAVGFVQQGEGGLVLSPEFVDEIIRVLNTLPGSERRDQA